jgi:hypothetical protein
MSGPYTRQETLDAVHAELSKGPEQFYDSNCVNWQGVSKREEIPYSEIIAEYLMKNNFDEMLNISTISRESYFTASHRKPVAINYSNRNEENFVKYLVRMQEENQNPVQDSMGKIIDYQVPLKMDSNSKCGKIDVLSLKNNCLYLVEIKAAWSSETLLRCMLEIETYYRTVDKEKLLRDFKEEKKSKQAFIPFDVSEVKKMIVIFNDSLACIQYQAPDKFKYLAGLLGKLNIEVQVLPREIWESFMEYKNDIIRAQYGIKD